MAAQLFRPETIVAERQRNSDRLVLAQELREAVIDTRLSEEELRAAHKFILKWADFDDSGRLETLNETQMQGDFLTDVFGHALGYAGASEGLDTWHRQQHHAIGDATPDAILGYFRDKEELSPLAVIELKGPKVHLDRRPSGGRSAVDQCWDYLVNTPPTCRWGIVSNMVSFRLYERNKTKLRYEHFRLHDLRVFETFREFYVLFHRTGLIETRQRMPSRTAQLVDRTNERQQSVGDRLYAAYSEHRLRLIEELHLKRDYPLKNAIEMAQRLFDRVIFVAFCEDRGLLPKKTIPQACIPGPFHAESNPKWRNFKNLFRFIDAGNATHNIERYNGGLFAHHDVDEIELDDVPWVEFFRTMGTYDFADEVNLDVLGHLFERSITELERLKESGLFGGNKQKIEEFATMPQSVKRKRLGIYYTPPELTERIVQYTVGDLIDQRFADAAVRHGISRSHADRGVTPDDAAYWHECLAILRNLKIVDPACGSGAFLFQAYNTLEARYHDVIGQLDENEADPLYDQVARFILQENLYGVDLSAEAVEITQLALWIRSAVKGQTLANLSANIVHGNSLVHDPEVHEAGFDWKERFPAVFNREEAGFDCVIGNPPWERIKLQEREFFSLPAPEIATATNAAKRRKLVEKLESDDPALFARYQEALESADALLTYCRKSDAYPLTGRGDINTYAVFAELAYQLVAPHGLVGLLVPSGIASDNTTKDFFAAVAETNRLRRLYDFENKKVFFPDVHPSFRFCILNFGGTCVSSTEADYVFFVHAMTELEDKKRHIALSGDDIKLLNPNTKTCPILENRRDANLMKQIYRKVPVLIDENRRGPTANPWGIKFMRMFDQTNDAEQFRDPETLKADGYKLEGNRWKKRSDVCIPIYEAKMFRPYDHRYGTVFEDTSNWINQGQTHETTPVEHQNPEHLVLPRWWVSEAEVTERLGEFAERVAFVGFRDVTRATDTRTFLAAVIPYSGATNKIPLVLTSKPPRVELCLLANLNSIPLDFCTKRKFGGISLNYFIVQQIPVIPPDTYAKPCSWQKEVTLETWISERVLKLSCTAEDMLPLADACDFRAGSFREYDGRLNKWDEAERAELMAELDAAFFHLYGLDANDAEYILSTFKGIHDKHPLFGSMQSQADMILRKFKEFAVGGW